MTTGAWGYHTEAAADIFDSQMMRTKRQGQGAMTGADERGEKGGGREGMARRGGQGHRSKSGGTEDHCLVQC